MPNKVNWNAKKFKVLIDCRNDGKKKFYVPGDTVTTKDFPLKVIKNWLDITPPVLEEIKGGDK